MLASRAPITRASDMREMLRALATLQGSLELLSPGYPIVGAARELASDRLEAELTPENLTEDVKREVIRLAPMLRRAPYHLDRLAGDGQVEDLPVLEGLRRGEMALFADELIVSRHVPALGL